MSRTLSLVVLAACASPAPAPSPAPPVAPVVAPAAAPSIAEAPAACPPLGVWTLTIEAACAARPEHHAIVVHAGPPLAGERPPMFDVLAPVVASGRSDDGTGYDRVLRITDAHATATGCAMQLHAEYVGPHEAIQYEATATVTRGRVRGSGTYTYLADDCESDEPGRCTCESPLTIAGTV